MTSAPTMTRVESVLSVLRDALLETGEEGAVYLTEFRLRALCSYLAAGGDGRADAIRSPVPEMRSRLHGDMTSPTLDAVRTLAAWDDARWVAERSRGGTVWLSAHDGPVRYRLRRLGLDAHVLEGAKRRRTRDGANDGRWGDWRGIERLNMPTPQAIARAQQRWLGGAVEGAQ